MFEAPWFENDILHKLALFTKTYFVARTWFVWMFFVFVVCLIAFLCTRKALKDNPYKNAFTYKSYIFRLGNNIDSLALFCLGLALTYVAYYMFSNENNLFENYDLMAFNTTRTLFLGLVASFDFTRIAPFASWEMSFLYAITQNFILIKVFVFLQIVLIAYLAYCFFDNISPARRLFAIAILMITPAMISTSSIIFPERDLLVAILLSLICAKNYVKSSLPKWAGAFLFFLNIAIYTKESAVFFYFGILATSLLYNIWCEKITLKNLLKPWKLINAMPLEFLICISLALFSLIYFLLISLSSGYATQNQVSLATSISHYKAELILLIVTIIYLAVDVCKKACPKTNPLFSYGMVVAALSVTVGIIFVAKLVPQSPHLAPHTYYMLLAVFPCLFYLFISAKDLVLLRIMAAVFVVYAMIVNSASIENRVGRYYREVAEFIGLNMSATQINIIHVEEKEYATHEIDTWVVDSYSTAYFYYFRKIYNIVFKSKHHTEYALKQIPRVPEIFYFWIETGDNYKTGDWVIVNKEMPLRKLNSIQQEINQAPVFENKLFEVYKIK